MDRYGRIAAALAAGAEDEYDKRYVVKTMGDAYFAAMEGILGGLAKRATVRVTYKGTWTGTHYPMTETSPEEFPEFEYAGFKAEVKGLLRMVRREDLDREMAKRLGPDDIMMTAPEVTQEWRDEAFRSGVDGEEVILDDVEMDVYDFGGKEYASVEVGMSVRGGDVWLDAKAVVDEEAIMKAVEEEQFGEMSRRRFRPEREPDY